MNKLKKIFGIFGHKSELTNEGSTKIERSHQYEELLSSEGYQCPMKCEGDKMYDSPGNCPVCNMKLIPSDDKKADGNLHHSCC